MFQHVFSGDAPEIQEFSVPFCSPIHGTVNLSLGFKGYSVNAQVNEKLCFTLQEKKQDCT